MIKDLHLHIDLKLASEIETLAKKNNTKLFTEYERLLRYGLSYEEKFRKLDLILDSINKNNSNIYYIKKLLEQVYSDLRLEQIDPSKSENLIKFSNKYRRDKNKLSD